jgi:hypothetical protein
MDYISCQGYDASLLLMADVDPASYQILIHS